MKFRNCAAIFGLACCFFCRSAFGQADGNATKQQCSPSTLKLVGGHFDVSDLSFPREGMSPSLEHGGLVVSAACKAWPGGKSQTIAAIAYDAGVKHEKRLLVALLDPSAKEVLAAYSGTIEEEATINVGTGSLGIDTARYDLAAGVRAFGIDVESAYGQGCVDGGLGPSRTLFIQEDNRLRPVLERFYLSTWSFVQLLPTCAGGAKSAITETVSYKIGIGTKASNGFSDLRITATSSYSNGARPRRKPLSYELRYDGKVYPTEASFNGAAGKIDSWIR